MFSKISPAIIVVGYNRPLALERLLQSISKANYAENNITLIISIDKANNEHEVVSVAKSFQWEYGNKIIRTFNERQGLRKHVLQCGDLSEQYGAVIILEDDLIVSPNYYQYTKDALNYYEDKESVTGIALYSHEWNGYAHKFFMPIADEYDTYLGQFSITWGQCWTKKWWQKFKKWYFENENKLTKSKKLPDNINSWSEQSWGRYFINYMVAEDLYYVIPRIALSTNCSEIGQHAKQCDNDHQVRLLVSDNYSYKFADVKEAQKYDVYFENKRLNECFESYIAEEGVMIDLSGYGRIRYQERYILTTLDLPYKIIDEFALQLRPIDMNIILKLRGKGIKLYDTMQNDRVDTSSFDLVMKYELRGLLNKSLFKYVLHQIKNKVIKRK